MEKDDKKNQIILTEIIKARHVIKNELLYYNEFDNFLKENQKLKNIIRCEVRDISESSIFKNNKVNITLCFNILVLYECNEAHSTKTYQLYTENILHPLEIDLKLYNPQPYPVDGLKCRNLVKNIRYFTDIDLSYSKFILSINASIESILLKEELLTIPIPAAIHNNNIQPQNALPQNSTTSIQDDEEIDTYLHNLKSLIGRAAEVSKRTKQLEEDIALKHKRIEFLEYKKYQAEEETLRLQNEIKHKESIIEDLKHRLEKSNRKITLLEDSNKTLSNEIDTLMEEITSLKNTIEDEESKKKKQINYRIKSALNNMKTLV